MTSSTRRSTARYRRPGWAAPLLALLALVVAGPAGGEARADEGLAVAVLADGRRIPAAVRQFTDQRQVKLAEADGELHTVALDELVAWGVRRDWRRGSLVLLADGGWLVGELVELRPTEVLLFSTLWGELTLRREHLSGVLIQPPLDPLERDALVDQVLEHRGGEDELVLDNEDRLRGVLVAPPDGPRRAAHDELPLRLEVGRGVVDVSLDRVAVVAFGAELSPRVTPGSETTWLGFADGSHLPARAIGRPPGTRVQLPTWAGVELEAYGALVADELVRIRPAGSAAYLSDLEPLGYRHIPFLEIEWPYGRDRNVRGGRLRAGGRIWSKGLGMPSSSRLAYQIGGRYERFEAQLAIDDLAGNGGSVVARVLLDHGDGQWTTAFESDVVRGGAEPLEVAIDVRGAERLALLVSYADQGDVLDYANWLDARLLPASP